MIQNLEKGLSLPRQLAFWSLLGAVIMLGFVAYTLAVFIHDGGVGGMPVEMSAMGVKICCRRVLRYLNERRPSM